MDQEKANKLFTYMKKEINRSLGGLVVPRHPKPYYISYLYKDTRSYNTWARYGSLGAEKKEHNRHCFADVRVGNYSFDHVIKGGLTDNKEDAESTDLVEMPLDESEDGVRFALWRLTDAKYREAVASYHGRKSRDISYLDENRGLPSWQPCEPARNKEALRQPKFRESHFKKLVMEASRIFKKYPEIKSSYCDYTCELQTKLFLSTEGTVRQWQQPHHSLSAYIWYHSKKVNQDYTLTYDVTDPKELPNLKKFVADIEDKINLLYSLEKADRMTSFTGPVLLAPQPAGLFIHEVLGHRLEVNRLLSDSEGKTFQGRLGQKIMHEGLSIYDDPSIVSYQGRSLVGSYAYDDEGVKPVKAHLVERGKLIGFLSSRSPTKKRGHESNGHARTQGFERPISRMANLFIKSENGHSWDELKQRLCEEIRSQGLPYGMILLEVEGGETDTESYDFQAFMGQVTLAFKITANGKESLVRGVDFVGTPLSSLANIIATGNEQAIDNSYCGAESGTIPVSTISPALLLSNLELQLKSPTRVTQYALPLPWVKQKKK
ncbi:MAG: TldD/PmbA family protein [Pseudobacteriovorax sp.]|nr:TldD/PmbA family protein [Pseudobacteriovorax sp.]